MVTEETRQKMREAKLRNPVRYWLGKKISSEHNAKLQAGKALYPPSQLGVIRTDEQKSKISQSLKKKYASGELVSPLVTMGIIGKRGPESPNWQGGKTFIGQAIRKSLMYKEWRMEILKRDDFTCRECGIRGGKLHADHIKPFAYFPDLRFDLDNGRTLCIPCHRLTPTWGAQKVHAI